MVFKAPVYAAVIRVRDQRCDIISEVRIETSHHHRRS